MTADAYLPNGRESSFRSKGPMVALTSVLALVLLVVLPSHAASVSYAILQSDGKLVRISADGKQVAVIATELNGAGLTTDASGNYIVPAKDALLRITRSGAVTRIASAPPDAYWTSAVVDSQGNIILADGRKPIVWRVSADGSVIAKVATFPGLQVPRYRWVALCLDSSGDYMVLVCGRDWGKTEFFRVSPGGSVIAVPLKGVVTNAPKAIVPAGSGRFLFTSGNMPYVFSLTTDGRVDTFADIGAPNTYAGGLARDPNDGEVIVTAPFSARLMRVSPDGAKVSEFARHHLAIAVVPEPAH